MDISKLDREKLAAMFDHTNLKAFSSDEEIIELCRETEDYGFASVMVNPARVALCKENLNESVLIGTVVGFPLGQNTIETKLFEAEDSIRLGAGEVDYVLNVAEVKNGNYDYIKREMQILTEKCHELGARIKVIFENCYLDKSEIEKVALIAKEVKPDFIKTSTGFGTSGALVEDVKLMKDTVSGEVKVKSAGGIRTWEVCREMILAGADRIGTSSSITILDEFEK